MLKLNLTVTFFVCILNSLVPGRVARKRMAYLIVDMAHSKKYALHWDLVYTKAELWEMIPLLNAIDAFL